jgi:hypothetical protein
MPELRKATLLEIDNDNQPRAGSQPVPVQFNPASLRLQFSNQTEGGRHPGRQARQYTGSGSTTLNVELMFDTADEGSTAVPRSVLERTREVERFMTPQSLRGSHQAPPRLRFQWGNLIVDGVMESLSVDLDHFAHDGTPLRAKAMMAIRGQHPQYDFNQSGPGANTAVGASASAAGSAQPGALGVSLGASIGIGGGGSSIGGSVGASIGLGAAGGLSIGAGAGAQTFNALEGESLAQLAARAGTDPAAWRALGGGVADPLRLPAGREVNVPAGASAAPGVGATPGVQADALRSATQRVGLDSSAAVAGSGPDSSLARGHALAGAGGLGAAIETVKADAGVAGAAQARAAFAGAAGAGGHAGRAVDALSAAAGSPGTRNQVFSLRADPRADTFGRGVPLRDRVQVGHDERANLLAGQAVVGRSGDTLPPTTVDPSMPGWVALPLRASSAEATTSPHARGCGCGCGG